MNRELCRVNAEELQNNGVNVSASLLRKWRHTHQHPQLFLKVGSRLHFDLIQWKKLLVAMKAKREREITRLNDLGLLSDLDKAAYFGNNTLAPLKQPTHVPNQGLNAPV
jgi:transposase-like protein